MIITLVPIIVELNAAMENIADLIAEASERHGGYQVEELRTAFILLSLCAVAVVNRQPVLARALWSSVGTELCELHMGRLQRFLAYVENPP